MVIIIQKMLMTGAMCVIAPGSSLQLLVAVLVTLIYMLLVLKTAPYEEDSEDHTSFVACLTLTLTTVGGLLLITDIGKTPTYESTLLGGLLVGMAISCIVVEIGIVVLFDCRMYEKIYNRIKDGKKSDDDDDEKDNEGKENEGDNISVLIKQTTKVTPVSTESESVEHTISIADTMEMHKQWISVCVEDGLGQETIAKLKGIEQLFHTSPVIVGGYPKWLHTISNL